VILDVGTYRHKQVSRTRSMLVYMDTFLGGGEPLIH
jgi:hypothetical protein